MSSLTGSWVARSEQKAKGVVMGRITPFEDSGRATQVIMASFITAMCRTLGDVSIRWSGFVPFPIRSWWLTTVPPRPRVPKSLDDIRAFT